MAYVNPRKNADGEITSYQVKWRLGGPRTAPQQTERFDDEESAEVFRKAVDEHGQQWPPGWVKGQGYIDPSAGLEAQYRFDAYARKSIENRTGVEARYKDASLKELETYIVPTFGNCDVRSTVHFSKGTVGAWVNQMAATKVWRGSTHKPMSPKTLKNLHGLLSSILKEAVQEEPPLRARNPCDLTRLPRTDDGGVEDEGEDEDMCFLTPGEVQAVVDQLDLVEDKKLVRVAYATGFRWGELTAVPKRNAFLDPRDGKHKMRITRAWKRRPGEGYYLGKPKSKRSRRTVRVTASTWQDLMDLGLEARKAGDLIIQGGGGGRLPYSTFYDRWVVAVRRAHEADTLPAEKHPTIHDLRHSIAAALLSAGRSLTYVQRFLGHESITTTSDRYGHLLPEADDDAMETIEAALSRGAGGAGGDVLDVPAPGFGRSLYVAQLDTRPVGFWSADHAEETAERWAKDRGLPVRVEKWSADWWVRAVGNGLKDVRDHVPDRVWVWAMGPTVYTAAGTERVVAADVHEPSGRWVWEWEESYTDELSVWRAEWCPGPDAETEAAAWGLSQDAVRGAYAVARMKALEICALNPARVSGGREAVM